MTNNKGRYKTEVRNNSFAFFTEDSINNGIPDRRNITPQKAAPQN